MNKVIVETKSRSKHVFEVNDEAITSLGSIMSDRGFDKMSYLKNNDTYFKFVVEKIVNRIKHLMRLC